MRASGEGEGESCNWGKREKISLKRQRKGSNREKGGNGRLPLLTFLLYMVKRRAIESMRGKGETRRKSGTYCLGGQGKRGPREGGTSVDVKKING